VAKQRPTSAVVILLVNVLCNNILYKLLIDQTPTVTDHGSVTWGFTVYNEGHAVAPYTCLRDSVTTLLQQFTHSQVLSPQNYFPALNEMVGTNRYMYLCINIAF